NRTAGAVLALLALLPTAARGQSWESPTFFAPRLSDDIGLYLYDAEDGDLGVMGIWRQSGRVNLGVRAGFGGASGDRLLLVGAEVYGMIVEPDAERPLAIAWLAGAGATTDGATVLRIPVGVSAGARLPAGDMVFTPYVHPRIALDYITVDGADGTGSVSDTEFHLDADLGAELEVGPVWRVRVAFTLGDRTAFGFGVAYRIPRQIAVR
ncbi:MAG: hypothetical protein PVH00_12760, partial [Gemmatimonadota bacterium]